MGVHGGSGTAKAFPRTTLAVLRPSARQRHQIGQASWHFSADPVAQCLAETEQARGLGPEESGGLDDLLDLGSIGGRVVGSRPVLGEQDRGYQIDTAVGGLRAQDRRNEELERIGVVQLAVGVRIKLGKLAVDPAGPAD